MYRRNGIVSTMTNRGKLPYHHAFEAAARKATEEHGNFPMLVGIHGDMLVRNVSRVRRRLGSRTLCAVLKGDAYGHGIRLVVPHIARFCSHIAFVDNSEAAAIRAAGTDVKLLRLRIGTPGEIVEAIEKGWNVRETICSRDKVAEVNGIGRRLDRVIEVHVSLDVAGLGRNGLPVDDAGTLREAISFIASRNNLRLASIGCHLPLAAQSTPSDRNDASRRALEKFASIAREIAAMIDLEGKPLPEISAYSSASSSAFGASGILEELGLPCFDRIGNSLFGLTSTAKHPEPGTGQVMHAAALVCDRVFRCSGSTIGYEQTYMVGGEGEEIALLGVGWLTLSRYCQGVGKTETPAFVINDSGGRHLLLGRQSMNIAAIRARDDMGRALSSGDLVYLTTDWGSSEHMPSVPRLCDLLGGVQTEFVTSSFGSSPSSLRFLF